MSGIIDGELTSHKQQRVTRHIAGCKRCARVLTSLRATLRGVQLLADDHPAPTGSVADDVLRRIAGEDEARR